MIGVRAPGALLACLLSLGCLSCGYSAKPLVRDGYRTVAVSIFENPTVRRAHEFDLTNAVTRAIHARTPYRIAAEDKADLVMAGTILDYRTPALVEDRRDLVIESRVDITLQIVLTDRSGRTVAQNTATRGAEFSTRRGESEESARAEVIEQLARWAVTTLEEKW